MFASRAVFVIVSGSDGWTGVHIALWTRRTKQTLIFRWFWARYKLFHYITCNDFSQVKVISDWFWLEKQGHHHNGDWVARRPHILCSICFHSFEALGKTYDCYSLHHFRASQCILKCVLLTLSSTSNRFAGIWKGNFSTPGLGVREIVGVRRWACFSSPPLGYY